MNHDAFFGFFRSIGRVLAYMPGAAFLGFSIACLVFAVNAKPGQVFGVLLLIGLAGISGVGGAYRLIHRWRRSHNGTPQADTPLPAGTEALSEPQDDYLPAPLRHAWILTKAAIFLVLGLYLLFASLVGFWQAVTSGGDVSEYVAILFMVGFGLAFVTVAKRYRRAARGELREEDVGVERFLRRYSS